MRIAAVYLSHFVYLAERKRRRELAGTDFIVGDGEPPRRVLDCSPRLAELGVFGGAPLRQAQSRAPGVLWLAPDYPYYRDLWDETLDALWQISPEVEDGGPGEAPISITGLLPHYGSEQAIGEAILRTLEERSLRATVGIADGKFPARAAAMSGREGRVLVLTGNEERFLAHLSVDVLPIDPALVDRLHLLGLDELGDLAQLPLRSLVAQFGPLGSKLWELANGIDASPLIPRQPSPMLEEWLSFEGPVIAVDVLIAAARQLISRLHLELSGRGSRQITLRAGLPDNRTWEKRLVLREAVSEGERLFFVVKTTLAETPPSAPVLDLGIRLQHLVGETGRQLSLGERRDREALREPLSQLKARYGHSPIYHCVEVEPWSVIPEDRYVLIESDGS